VSCIQLHDTGSLRSTRTRNICIGQNS
jgi:hypothetical protein